MNPESSIGSRLKAARQRAKLTQAQLAKKAGLWENWVCRLEKGVHQPNVATLIKLADALGVDLGVLVVGAGSSRAVNHNKRKVRTNAKHQ